MTRPAVIEIRELWKTYQLGEVEVHALRGVSLGVESGEFVAVMGASGSGKSTLMNIVGCLDRPTQGSYLLEGEDVAELPEETLATIRGRKIGFVFQNFNLLARTSALENIELPLFYSAWSGAGERRAEDLMKMLGLDGREANHPNQLSGGQQQRVAIARAIVSDPTLLVCDEPTGDLDRQSAEDVLGLLRVLNREHGKTVVMVTHDPKAAEYANHTLHLDKGTLVEQALA
jgi:putative ABC transport system ATP-binding protein